MNDAGATDYADRARELARAFDASFATPERAPDRDTVDYVAIGVGEGSYALPMNAIGGLFADLAITPCPSPLREFMGLAAFRGTMVPVYDLGALLGHEAGPRRWVVPALVEPVALAFDRFEGHLRAGASAITRRQEGGATGHLDAVLVRDGEARPIVSIPSLVATLRERAGLRHKER
jgi:purine-binding chemotaxis protein CheW